MKVILCAIFLGLAAVSAQALPILTTTFTQSNWSMVFTADLTDNGSPVIGDLYINGTKLAEIISIVTTYDFPENPAEWDLRFQLGENIPTAIVGGVTIYGTPFTITMPVGPKPTDIPGVPDAGSAAGLLALGLAGCAWVHRRFNS